MHNLFSECLLTSSFLGCLNHLKYCRYIYSDLYDLNIHVITEMKLRRFQTSKLLFCLFHGFYLSLSLCISLSQLCFFLQTLGRVYTISLDEITSNNTWIDACIRQIIYYYCKLCWWDLKNCKQPGCFIQNESHRKTSQPCTLQLKLWITALDSCLLILLYVWQTQTHQTCCAFIAGKYASFRIPILVELLPGTWNKILIEH